jgi:hypothetical protein
MIKLNNILELLMKKHNITDQDILNSCPDYSSTKVKAFPVNILKQENVHPLNKSVNIPVKAMPELAPSVRPAPLVRPKVPPPKQTRSKARPALEPSVSYEPSVISAPSVSYEPSVRPAPSVRPVLKPKFLKKSTNKKLKKPSNNKTHSSINNNLESRAKIIRDKIAKQQHKPIIKKEGIKI